MHHLRRNNASFAFILTSQTLLDIGVRVCISIQLLRHPAAFFGRDAGTQKDFNTQTATQITSGHIRYYYCCNVVKLCPVELGL
jgi:hypothetical protein